MNVKFPGNEASSETDTIWWDKYGCINNDEITTKTW